MVILKTVEEVRAFRMRNTAGPLGFVPTMGFLHEGHASLVRRSVAENDTTVTSIFVNPKQFDEAADLEAYPRDLDGDTALLSRAGCDALFLPDVDTIYPPGFQTTVSVADVAAPLEGASRPGHFDGVATVVLKLLQIVMPARAYFGQKDAQQLAVVRRMVTDLAVPVRIIGSPTVREADGLAMSSRNARLSPAERKAATVLHRALEAARAAHDAGEGDAERLRAIMRDVLTAEPLARVDYVSAADPLTLTEIDRADGPALLSLAVRIGSVRLIDNLIVGDEDRTAAM